MSREEAKVYVDLIVEKLYEWGIISEQKYGHMTEDQREVLAKRVVEKSEE